MDGIIDAYFELPELIGRSVLRFLCWWGIHDSHVGERPYGCLRCGK